MAAPLVCLFFAAALAASPAWGQWRGSAHASHGGRGPAAQAPWTDLPIIEPVRGRGESAVNVRNLAATELEVHPSFGAERLVDGLSHGALPGAWRAPVGSDGSAPLESRGGGNYYWLQAREEGGGTIRLASTVRYFASPGPAPTALLAEVKGALEIVPQPLPREHWQYRAGSRWPFLVRFAGKPLAYARLRLQTEHASRAEFLTDAQGLAQVEFPRDLPAAPADARNPHGMPPAARFVLAVAHQEDGRRYLTAFNYTYGADAYQGRSLLAGAGFVGLGGLIAAALVLRPVRGRKA